jgi:hypothetical protein
MTAKTPAQKNFETRQRKKNAGLVRVEVWIPKGLDSLIREQARIICEDSIKK